MSTIPYVRACVVCACLGLAAFFFTATASSQASAAMQDVTDWALQMRYRTTAARILDAHRKFLDASVRFYELSQAQVPLFA